MRRAEISSENPSIFSESHSLNFSRSTEFGFQISCDKNFLYLHAIGKKSSIRKLFVFDKIRYFHAIKNTEDLNNFGIPCAQLSLTVTENYGQMTYLANFNCFFLKF